MSESDHSRDPTIPEQQPELPTEDRPNPMDPLYDELLHQDFEDSTSAVEFCRNLAFNAGFTVKQEASANRNIYVYCSREGAPDSRRNPKAQRQRKRPSKRCDCRWRVVLYQTSNERYQFRRSLNPSASWHNHEMMPQEEMIKYWPPEVTDMIITLAGQRMATNDIRQRVQTRFPEVPWNERRFYNRITEERKRTRYRETTDRVHRLTNLSVRLCSVAAGAEDMAVKVEAELKNMLKQCCDFLKVSPESIASPIDFNQKDNIADEMSSASPKPVSTKGDDDVKVKGKGKAKAALRQTASSSSLGDGDDSSSKKRKLSDIMPKVPEGVKGSLPVVVPSYTLYIKSETLKKAPSDVQQLPSESPVASQTMTSQDGMELDSSQTMATRAQRRSRARNSLQGSSQEHHSPHLQAPHLPPPSQPLPQQSFSGSHLSHPMSGQQNPYLYHTFPVPPAVRGGDPQQQSLGNQDARYGMSSPIPTYGMNQEFSNYSMQSAFSSHSMQYGFPPGSNIPQGLHPAMIPGTDTMLPDKQQTPNGRQTMGDSQQMYVFDVQHPSNNTRQE
ncbi:hypothetical protein INT44_009303 [Umbelopsis vinacea]|uniref:FAR1 domain-containing protein n=1 Tax=Umbelopsis vinacea TaxID=44442 RepID=A0A8H7Q2U3_9FUNG|nr:hypothetical protein INT44_009303 [Umbelopsis vinacea]